MRCRAGAEGRAERDDETKEAKRVELKSRSSGRGEEGELSSLSTTSASHSAAGQQQLLCTTADSLLPLHPSISLSKLDTSSSPSSPPLSPRWTTKTSSSASAQTRSWM